MTITAAQWHVVQKIASYFKIPSKRLKEDVNEARQAQGVLSFDELSRGEIGLKEEFACVLGKFNLGQVLDPKKFLKTGVYAAYLEWATADKFTPPHIAYCSGGGIWVIEKCRTDFTIPPGSSAVILTYDYLGGSLVLSPIANYLRRNYPLPPV